MPDLRHGRLFTCFTVKGTFYPVENYFLIHRKCFILLKSNGNIKHNHITIGPYAAVAY